MKLFIWDFHGVLEKGNELAVQAIYNKVLEEAGIDKKITVEQVLEWYGLSWSDYYRKLCPGLDEETIAKLHENSVEVSKVITQDYLRPTDYAYNTLNTIVMNGHKNILISNTRPDRILDFADITGIVKYFDKIVGVPKSAEKQGFNIIDYKVEKINEYLNGKEFEQLINIGDMPHDIEVGDKVGAVTYLFSRNGTEKKYKNVQVIDDLRCVLEEL